MSDIAIRVEGLGKQYRIGKVARYETLRDKLSEGIAAPFRKVGSLLRGGGGESRDSELFWALKDVSFEVPRGSVLGVIGRNGAGKSTLLKLLSRITEPTVGRAEIHGRVGSLLEVGTGFHPELTGRDNIFLNGAILGMKKTEIARKFDEIVAFAEVEKFIDTAVKHYSSGMYMRLAFAVAAHLEPEILIVDEVLAVGDAAFQKKCLGKMDDVAKHGRTVLFVSHNMTAVESLCSKCVLLSQGSVQMIGDTREVVYRHLSGHLPAVNEEVALDSHSGRTNGSLALMRNVKVSSSRGDSLVIRMGDSLVVDVWFDSKDVPLVPVLGIVVKNAGRTPLYTLNNRFIHHRVDLGPLTKGKVRLIQEKLPLMPGNYIIDLFLGNQEGDLDIVEEAISFEVVAADVFGTGKLPASWCGSFFQHANFEIEDCAADLAVVSCPTIARS
ncbi:MAG: ABC transporter ATP-binding protein [Bryobacteraceae bacterium]